VPAVRADVELDAGGHVFGPRDGIGADEGIVARLDDAGRDTHLRQERPGTGAGVVVAGIGKAVQRGGHGVVELAECARAGHGGHIDGQCAPQVRRTCAGRAFHAAHEVRLVDARKSAVDARGAGVQVKWHGDRHGRGQRRANPFLAQVLEQRIAAQGKTDRRQRGVRLARSQRLDEMADVARIPRVIGARQPIRLAAAATEMHEGYPQARRDQPGREAAHVVRQK